MIQPTTEKNISKMMRKSEQTDMLTRAITLSGWNISMRYDSVPGTFYSNWIAKRITEIKSLTMKSKMMSVMWEFFQCEQNMETNEMETD